MDFETMVVTWLKNNIGPIMMGIAGTTVAALVSPMQLKQKIITWIVGAILAAALSGPTSMFLSASEWAGVFGFFYGLGGIGIAKLLMKVIEKRSKMEIENRTGVSLDDDSNANQRD